MSDYKDDGEYTNRWISVDSGKLPSVSEMVLLYTPTFAGGYCGVTYGWRNMDNKWMHHTVCGAAEIVNYISKGRYESAVEAWTPMPPVPEVKD